MSGGEADGMGREGQEGKGMGWVVRTLETGVLLVGLGRDGGGGDRMERQCGAVPVGVMSGRIGPIRSQPDHHLRRPLPFFLPSVFEALANHPHSCDYTSS